MTIFEIVKQALKLESGLYRKIEKNKGYKSESIIIVAITILLSSIGFKGLNVVDIVFTMIYISIGLALWAVIIFIISFKLLSIRIKLHDFITCLLIGFCPMMFNILYLVPILGFYISIIIFLWTVASISLVIKELLEQEFATSIMLSALGSTVYFIIRIGIIG